MPSAKYTETYKKVSAMGEKLKAAGKQGPSNDEQLHVRFFFSLNPSSSMLVLSCGSLEEGVQWKDQSD
jgi:hypothetical protein